MSTKAMEAFLRRKENMDEAERIGEDLYFLEFRKLREESDKLKTDPFYSTSDGEKSCNTPKNRYKDILPFNYNRVKLKETSEADNDYINASFIKSTGSQKFIAAQGPLPKTVADFWSMIWDYDIRVVIMACQEYEGHPLKLKCFRYWSQNKEEELVFGKITVNLVEESVLSETNGVVVRRELVVRKAGSSRTVVQLHHTRWPDKFIPACVDSILGLLSHMRDYHGEKRSEPILIHCSAGCGRTGSLLVIEYVWSLLRNRKICDDFSLFDIITNMRKQRMAIVQSLDQYQFVYGAVAKLFQQKNILPIEEDVLAEPDQPTTTLSARVSRIVILPAIPNSKGGDCVLNLSNSVEATREKAKIIRPTNYKYMGYDIGFPNRVPRPRGPRTMPQPI